MKLKKEWNQKAEIYILKQYLLGWKRSEIEFVIHELIIINRSDDELTSEQGAE